ncbi:hypothetical protein ISTM_318 [Insectomime virus]|uniref:Uncharacterized protein n=1 Tax=Tunisvirus fontaine2 TaxID=1421067 RepID=V9SH02_9VIRU|nr:hypothetical protein D1R32_gp482 [Tunisvirus fontaine2]AHA46216.1 hypothetical protein ISTM_318 [Insectomime virus]AHC55199.1 hypothetical protein TNS_ORF481 [Tunisvirus fontaine2]
MFEFLKKRELVALSLCDWDVQKSSEKLVCEQTKAAEKIAIFWERYGRKMHFPNGAKEEYFIGHDDPFAEYLYPKRWFRCKLSNGEFVPDRSVDVISLLRITGKNIWKVEIVSNNYSIFSIYVKKRDKTTTFCIELPFVIPLHSLRLCHVTFRVHGEKVDKIETRGIQISGRWRDSKDSGEHTLFYGRVVIRGGVMAFPPRDFVKEQTRKNISTLFKYFFDIEICPTHP